MPAINVMAVRAIDVAERPRFYSILNVLNNSAKIVAPAFGTITSSLASEVQALGAPALFASAALSAAASFGIFHIARLAGGPGLAPPDKKMPAGRI